MKSPIVLHAAWLAVAAGAFYGGSLWQNSRAAGTSPVDRMVTSQTGPARTAIDVASTLKASAVSADPGIAAFLARYELGAGKPLSPEKMREAMTEALRETDPVKSTMLFARLLEELTPENAKDTVDAVRGSIAGFEMMRYMPLLAYKWGAVDSEGAFAEMSKMDGRMAMMGQPIVLAGLASKDPAAAQAWLDKQDKDMAGREWYTQSLINGLAKSDVKSAVSYAEALEKADDRARSAETIAREQIKNGIDGAAAWATSLSDPDMKRGAFQAVAEQITRTDLGKATEFVKQYAGEEWAAGSVGNVAEQLAEKDPKQGIDFAASVAGPGQARAYGEAISEWTRKDAEAASTFVNQMPVGQNRDSAAGSLAREVANEDPSGAVVWASSIADPKSREDTLVDVARTYLRTSPQEAALWLPQSGLSEEAQARVTEPRRGWGGGWGR